MDWLSWLWLPIVLSAAGVFIASFLTWTVLPTHKRDFIGLPDEKGFIEAVRRMGLKPGNYGFPHFASHKEANTPEARAMWKDGPVGFITILSNPTSMAPRMAITFALQLAVSFLIAYVASVTLHKGDSFAKVFQTVGTVGVLSYAFSHVPHGVWFGAYKRAILAQVFDGVVYGLITGAIFAWRWPTA